MVAMDNDDVTEERETEPTLQSESDQHPTTTLSHHVIPPPSLPLGRQLSSVYSLTLDEFQQTVCETGKNFGSMNMDEFINSIWTAEEQAQSHPAAANLQPGDDSSTSNKYPVPKQGKITIPTPLCQKTVEEVWSEIQKTHQGDNHVENSSSADKQPTFGEMTLEGFLIKAGIVREQYQPSSQLVQDPLLTWYQNNNNVSVMGPTPTSAPTPTSTYLSKPGYPAAVQSPVYNRIGNITGLEIVSPVPVSPVSSDGVCGNAMEIGVLREGRKRNMDRPGERVVERRQRRMIKNRESAARSRARKQAYTVELEAELNILKEENIQLKQALVCMRNMAELGRKKKHQSEEKKAKAQKNAVEKLRTMQRSMSGPL